MWFGSLRLLKNLKSSGMKLLNILVEAAGMFQHLFPEWEVEVDVGRVGLSQF